MKKPIWRRFEVLEEKSLAEAELLIERKQLSRQELELLLRTFQAKEDKVMTELAAIKELAEPIVNWIREHHGANTEVHISWDYVSVKHDGIGIPFPYSDENLFDDSQIANKETGRNKYHKA